MTKPVTQRMGRHEVIDAEPGEDSGQGQLLLVLLETNWKVQQAIAVLRMDALGGGEGGIEDTKRGVCLLAIVEVEVFV